MTSHQEGKIIENHDSIFSDLFFKKLQKEKKGVILVARFYEVGRFRFLFSPLVLDYSTPVNVYPDRLEARVLFPFDQFEKMAEEEGAKAVVVNGRKMVEATVVLQKECLVKSAFFDPPY